MTLDSRRIGVLLACWATLVTMVGCTGTDVLNPGSGELEFRAELDNASGRFVDNSFDRAVMELQQIEVRPVAADADASLGPTSLALLATPFSANFVSGASGFAVSPQTSGAYRLVRMVLPRITLRDVDDLTLGGLSDPVNPTCQDFIKAASLDFTGRAIPYGIDDSDLPAPVTVSLDANSPGQLTLRLDYPAFLAAVNASLNCSTCSCPGDYMPNVLPRTCSIAGSVCSVDADCPAGQTCEDCTCPVSAVNFDGNLFKSLASTFVSFE